MKLIILIVCFISSLNVFAETLDPPTKDDFSISSEMGKAWLASTTSIDGNTGRVATDLATSYESMCGTPILISKMKEFLADPLIGKAALKIAALQGKPSTECSKTTVNCLVFVQQDEYMKAITRLSCPVSEPNK